MALKDAKYDGKGGLWKANHPQIAGQGSIQIGGRVIALTLWHNRRGGGAPEYNLTVNDQKTSFEDMCWFKALSPTDKPSSNIKGKRADVLIVDDLAPVDEDIPF